MLSNKNIIFKIQRKYYYILENLFCYLKRNEPDMGNVWMFHRISDMFEGNTNEEFWVSTERFLEVVEEALYKGVEFRPLEDIARSDNASVFITFDDGYHDIYINAYPILKKYKIPFAIFVTTDFINCPGYLTLGQLQELSTNPLCTIGAHTMSHPRLRKLEDIDVRIELEGSRRELEKKLNIQIHIMAYPYGNVRAVSRRNVKMVKALGFSYAFSTLQMSIKKSMLKERYFIPRWNINDNNIQYRLKCCTIKLINENI